MFQLSVIEFVLITLGCLIWGYAVRAIKERFRTSNGIFEVHTNEDGTDVYTMVITTPTNELRESKKLTFKVVKMGPRENCNPYNGETQ